MRDKILIFIPAYNCEAQLPRVLNKIDDRVQKFVDEVLVIDNCSKDLTLEAGKKFKEFFNIKFTLLRNRENYSLGGSIKRAFIYALENDYNYMIVLHGDDQADVRDLLPTLESGDYRQYDLLIGARFHPQSKLEGYSLTRIAGNRFLNGICSIIGRRRVDDLIAGLNCYKLDFFRSLFFMKFPNNLTFDAHVLLYAFSHGAHVKYLPITWREEDQISNAKVVRQAWIILKLFMSYLVYGKKTFSPNKSGRPEEFRYESELIFHK